MNIYAKEGDKVLYSGRGGYDAESFQQELAELGIKI